MEESIYEEVSRGMRKLVETFARLDVVKMKMELREEMIKDMRKNAANLREGLKPIVEGLDGMWKGLSGDEG